MRTYKFNPDWIKEGHHDYYKDWISTIDLGINITIVIFAKKI